MSAGRFAQGEKNHLKLYFAGPLFSIAEKTFNTSVADKIEQLGISVFLPQRDGAESQIENYHDLDKETRRISIFQIDYSEIIKSDIFLFILDGRVPDEGACFELGVAYTQKQLESKNKLIIGLHTDSRAAFIGAKLNPMIKIPLDSIFGTVEELITYLQEKVMV